MVIKGIPYPHRTWFQRFLKTDAAFGEIMNGEEHGILGATVRVLWTEEVPSDWWRYRFWEKIEFLNYRLRYFYFLEVLIWVVQWFDGIVHFNKMTWIRMSAFMKDCIQKLMGFTSG